MNVGIVFYIIEKTSSSRRKISKVKESARVIKRKLPSQIKFTKKQTNKYKQNKQTNKQKQKVFTRTHKVRKEMTEYWFMEQESTPP